jgi:hypothetical protein
MNFCWPFVTRISYFKVKKELLQNNWSVSQQPFNFYKLILKDPNIHFTKMAFDKQ